MQTPERIIQPRVMVLASLFPHAGQPEAGLFVRERMFRVGAHVPLTVVSPKPWFPGQGLIRILRPNYRPAALSSERQGRFDVQFPKFWSLPAIGRKLDGASMAASTIGVARKLVREAGVNLIDAHFSYPDGYAATRIGKRLGLPVTITMRGTELTHSRDPARRPLLITALRDATRVFAVSESLKRLAVELGIESDKIRVIGNGVDLAKFRPIPRDRARAELTLPTDAPIIVSVGGLVERKGFHRVLECLPHLDQRFANLHYLVIGGPSAEGDMSQALRDQARQLGLQDRVIFTGPIDPNRLHLFLSAADVFVLSTRNEGWANVFLEAMACGLPVVATDVGGNREVVSRPDLGTIVPFGDADALKAAIEAALGRSWDRASIIDYARRNTWDSRVEIIVEEFARLVNPLATEPIIQAA
jgi:teichuronic acid biosynthesis glycosyltransferase TuaC